jgi:hypothetical protein
MNRGCSITAAVLPLGRLSNQNRACTVSWTEGAPIAVLEGDHKHAAVLRCIAEVPVFVNYLLFSPPTIPWALGYPATRHHQTECGLI